MKQKKMEPGNSRYEQRFRERCVKEKSAEEQIKGVFDRILDEMAKEMDRGYMEAGKTLAELFRAVATAAAKLPALELRTEMMTVKNGDDGGIGGQHGPFIDKAFTDHPGVRAGFPLGFNPGIGKSHFGSLQGCLALLDLRCRHFLLGFCSSEAGFCRIQFRL